MAWYKIRVSEDKLAQGFETYLQSQLRKFYLKSGAPKGIAVFSTKPPDTSGDDVLASDHFIYFSPEAASASQGILSEYEGSTCYPPLKSEVYLLAGNNDYSL